MATITTPTISPEATPEVLHWNKAEVDDTGRFMIVRVLKPRKWILYDNSYLTIAVNLLTAPRIGAFDTRREARAFISHIVSVKPFYAPVFINTPISASLLPIVPSPIFLPPDA